MRCKKCKAPLEKGDHFCQQCGWRVRRRGRWIFLGVFLLLLIGAGLLWAWWEGWLPMGDRPETSYFVLLDEDFTQRTITDQETALAAIGDIAGALGLEDPAAELSSSSVENYLENTYYRFAQQYEGIPVYGRSMVVAADSAGTALTLTGNYRSLGEVDLSCPVSEEEALAAAAELYGENAALRSDGLRIYSLHDAQPELAWQITVSGPALAECCLISADSGEVLFREDRMLVESVSAAGEDVDGEDCTVSAFRQADGTYLFRDEARNITIYNANGGTFRAEQTFVDAAGHTYRLSGDTWQDENGQTVAIRLQDGKYVISDASGTVVDDDAAMELHFWSTAADGSRTEISPDGSTDNSWSAKAVTLMSRLAAVCDFYDAFLDRQGFDGGNGTVYAVYDDYNGGDTTNAYSTGDGASPFTLLAFGQDAALAYDLIAHEYTHSVERSISGMVYSGESGALMEAYSDIFGELVEDWCDDGSLNASCSWSNGFRSAADPAAQQYTYCSYEAQGESCPVAAENNGTHIYNPSYTVTRDSCVLRDSYPTEYLGTGYMTGDYDNGGVHLNSTVISHAAYLMSRGINGSAAFEELGTLELAELFYSALFSMPSDCTLSQFRTILERTAEILWEQGRLTEKQVKCVSNAFFQAGIIPASSVAAQVGREVDLLVYDVNESLCDDYTITLISAPVPIVGPVRPGESTATGGETVEYTVTAAEPFHLSLSPGYYRLTITDGTDRYNSQSYMLAVSEEGPAELPLYTSFGQYRPDDFDRYLAAARKTYASGSWREEMDMTAELQLNLLGEMSATVALSYDMDVDNYFPEDLSDLRMAGSTTLSALGQELSWDMTYAGGVAQYEYTRPALPPVELEMTPACFQFGSLKKNMVSSVSALPGGTVRFTVRGDAFTETGMGAMELLGEVADLRYGDVTVEAAINEDTGKIDTLQMAFTAYLTYQSVSASADFTINYRFYER